MPPRRARALGEAVAGEVSGGVHGAGALVIDEDDERVAVPAGEDFVHQFLGEEDGALDAGGLEFLAGADVDEPGGAVAEGLGKLGGGDLHAAVFLLAGEEVVDDLGDGQVLIAGADLGQRLVRAEAAGGAAADVVLAEEGALGAGGDLQQFAHGGVAARGRRWLA